MKRDADGEFEQNCAGNFALWWSGAVGQRSSKSNTSWFPSTTPTCTRKGCDNKHHLRVVEVTTTAMRALVVNLSEKDRGPHIGELVAKQYPKMPRDVLSLTTSGSTCKYGDGSNVVYPFYKGQLPVNGGAVEVNTIPEVGNVLAVELNRVYVTNASGSCKKSRNKVVHASKWLVLSSCPGLRARLVAVLYRANSEVNNGHWQAAFPVLREDQDYDKDEIDAWRLYDPLGGKTSTLEGGKGNKTLQKLTQTWTHFFYKWEEARGGDRQGEGAGSEGGQQ
jgi:hypothetical protein